MHAFPHSTSSTPTAIAVPPALSLPVIEAAFPRQLHPYWPRLQEKTRAWLLEKRLMPPDKVEEYADGLCYTDLMAGYYIGAPDEVLQAIADYSAWFFVWDDRHDRDIIHGRPGAWRRLRFQLHSGPRLAPEPPAPPGSPGRGFADSMVRLYSFLGTKWNARFARHFHAVIEAYDREFHNRTRASSPRSRNTSNCAGSPSRTGSGPTFWSRARATNSRTACGNTRHIGGRRCSARNSPPGTTTSAHSPRK